VIVPLAPSLAAAGLRPESIHPTRALFEMAAAALAASAADSRIDAAFFVPGRIEVLGKHTDYAGGRSLLCAAERGFCLVARARRDPRIVLIDARTGKTAETALEPALEPVRGHWSNYPATVARRVARNFAGARTGAEIAFASGLPPASGLSSSSAFMIAVFLAIAHLNDLANEPGFRSAVDTAEDLAGYLATVENGNSFGALTGDRGVGTFGGSEDHTAILCCRPGALSQYRFAPVQREREIALPAGLAFVVAVSGVVAEKTGAALAAYNRASLSAVRVLDAWREATGRTDPTLDRAVASDPDAIARMRALLDRRVDPEFPASLLRDRFEQFYAESRDIIPAAGDALAAGDLTRFGVLVDRSQDAAERWLGNQIPETISLARRARESGAIAASAFGAGFGGSVWALVSADQVEPFSARWSEAYRIAHPAAAARAAFFETRPGPSAHQIAWPLA
jgi:galactokinase